MPTLLLIDDDAKLAQNFEIEEISSKTLPMDFRNTKIHRCWRMVAR